MTETPREESDQLPEEAPTDHVAEDDGTSKPTRKDAEENAGTPDGGTPDQAGQATGNPANAG
jgi:hypothetical protein